MWNMFQVYKKDTRRRHWRRSSVFIVSFEHISHLVLVFLLLTLKMHLPAGMSSQLVVHRTKYVYNQKQNVRYVIVRSDKT